MKRKFLVAIGCVVLSLTAAHAQPLVARHLTVDLVARDTALVPGRDGQLLGLRFKLDAGWHIYWSNAGDSGDPPDAKWNLPAGITVGALQFPAPRRLPLGPLMDFGYEDAVLFPVPVNVANTVTNGTANISADIRWLVCREVCIPGKGAISLALPVAVSAAPNTAVAADFQHALDTLPRPLPAGTSVTVMADKANFYITVPTGHAEKAAEFFPAVQFQIANAAPQVITDVPDGVLLTIKKDDNLAVNPAALRGVVELSGGRNYTIAGSVVAGAPKVSARTQTNARELLRITALALLGGIILNLMPCVFPVLFIKGLGLMQSQGVEIAHSRRHGAVYTLGILVSFWAIVAVLLLLRAGGAAFGWGFQFQSPTFVAIITLLLFFFGLSLAGMFEFGLSLTSAGGHLAQKQGYAGSFFTGMLATVVATPCTAPFMGAAIGFALSQSVAVTFVIFTALALGLALPYVALTFFPAWTALLPRPGAWMEVLKQAASVPIFGTVIWLVWLYARLASVDLLVWLLAALLLIAIGAWMLNRWIRNKVGTFVAALVIAVAMLVPIYGQHAEAAAAARDTWQPWSAKAVQAAQQQGRPVFVDFTAAWCLSCQFNERTVLKSRSVEDAMAAANIVKLKADWTHYDGDITAALAQLGRSGVPTYVVYDAAGKVQLLPEALTQSVVLDAVKKASAGTRQ